MDVEALPGQRLLRRAGPTRAVSGVVFRVGDPYGLGLYRGSAKVRSRDRRAVGPFDILGEALHRRAVDTAMNQVDQL